MVCRAEIALITLLVDVSGNFASDLMPTGLEGDEPLGALLLLGNT